MQCDVSRKPQSSRATLTEKIRWVSQIASLSESVWGRITLRLIYQSPVPCTVDDAGEHVQIREDLGRKADGVFEEHARGRRV